VQGTVHETVKAMELRLRNNQGSAFGTRGRVFCLVGWPTARRELQQDQCHGHMHIPRCDNLARKLQIALPALGHVLLCCAVLCPSFPPSLDWIAY
jgi:hypothetical protein